VGLGKALKLGSRWQIAGQLDVPGETAALKATNESITPVTLSGVQTDPRRSRISMMIVVPGFAHRRDRRPGDVMGLLAYLAHAELSAGEIASRFDISKPAVSQHLAVLENAGLVQSEKRGQFVFYRLVPDNLTNALNGYVQEVCPVSRPLKAESAKIAMDQSDTAIASPDSKVL